MIRRAVFLVAALLLAYPSANGEPLKGDHRSVTLAGEWVSTKPQNVHFILDPSEYYSGIVLFNCAEAERKVRLTAFPSGAERVREIAREKTVRWNVGLVVNGLRFSGELVGGGGRLPSVLISSEERWLGALGESDGDFSLIIDETESYQLPTSRLITSTIGSCNPRVS